MNMKEELVKLGLSGQEAEVYIQLLKGREQNASNISKEIKINRTVVYRIIESLTDKGLVNCVFVNGIKRFSATKPEALIDFLKDKEKALKDILPRLMALSPELNAESRVEVYKGKQGGLAVMKDIIREGRDYVAFGEAYAFQEVMGTLAEQYVRQLTDKKIKERLLMPSGQKPILGRYSEARFLPKEIELPAVIAVYGDKVAIAIFQKPYYAIVIESKDLAKTYKSLFEYLWKIARK